VVRNLAEILRWLITASPHPTLVYTDHEALKTLLVGVDNDAHGRIANWQDPLGEYNVQLFHKSRKIHFMGITDGLSRLPTRILGNHVMEDSDRPDSVLAVACNTRLATPCNGEAAVRRRERPSVGPTTDGRSGPRRCRLALPRTWRALSRNGGMLGPMTKAGRAVVAGSATGGRELR
jgi:hypothetical protein